MPRSNLAFVGEEVRELGLTLNQITTQLVELIIERQKSGMGYGVVLIPEGLIEFIPEVGQLMKELNELLAGRESDEDCNTYACPIAPLVRGQQSSPPSFAHSPSHPCRARLCRCSAAGTSPSLRMQSTSSSLLHPATPSYSSRARVRELRSRLCFPLVACRMERH